MEGHALNSSGTGLGQGVGSCELGTGSLRIPVANNHSASHKDYEPQTEFAGLLKYKYY
jgi:hypothetical protein